jgi:HSP20 family molecular chaperone IbpA
MNLSQDLLQHSFPLLEVMETPGYLLFKVDVGSILGDEIDFEFTEQGLTLIESNKTDLHPHKRVSIKVDSDRMTLNARYKNGILWIRIQKIHL